MPGPGSPMKHPVTAIVQARMGASRFPNKMMLWFHGLPVIEWVWRRVGMAQTIDALVFAIPDTVADQVLADHLNRLGASVYRGSETDVLGRITKAAQTRGAGTVVRVCADNPLVSGSEIDRLVGFYGRGNYDYAYNHVPRGNSYPDGLGAEIVSMDLLERIDQVATEPDHREHAFNYVWDNQREFHIGTCDPLDSALAHPDLKLDLDTPADYSALLQLDVLPEMTAQQVVNAALRNSRDKNESQ